MMKKRIAIFIIVPVILSLFIGEILVRKFSKTGYMTPEILKNLSLQYEGSIFSRTVFPQKVQDVKSGNGASLHINSKGYRGKELETIKPKGTIRIIFYGGSAVFDINASNGKDWPHRVEQIFKEKGFSNIEVINAGTPSHASFDSVGRLFSEGHIFSPDYVVLYDAWNDIKYFRTDEPISRFFKPYQESSDPLLNYQNFLDKFLSEHSQLYVRLRTKYYLWRFPRNDQGVEAEGVFLDKIRDSKLEQYKLNVEMFVDLARNIKAVPVLLTEARLVTEELNKNQEAKVHYNSAKLTHKAIYEAFQKTDDIIKDVARRKNVQLIDASSVISGKDEFFTDEVHTTEKGSEALAELVADEFIKLFRQR